MLASAPARLARRLPARTALASLVLPLGLLSGCSGDSTDSAQPSPSASSTSATPTPTPSSSPAPRAPTAPKDTAKARAEFARFVVTAWGYALRTNKPGLVTDLSPTKAPCKGCHDFQSELAARKKRHWYVDFPGADIRKVAVHKQGAPKTYLAHVVVDIPASRSYFDDGSFRNVNNAHPRAPFDVVMSYVKGKYTLVEFQVG